MEIGDYAAIAAGARLFTADRYAGGARMSAALPPEQRNVRLGRIVLENDSFIGTNAVIHQNVVIGEGAVLCKCVRSEHEYIVFFLRKKS